MKSLLRKFISEFSGTDLEANSSAAVRVQTWQHDTFIVLIKIFTVLSAFAVVVQYFLLTYTPTWWEHLIVWGSILALLLVAFVENLPYMIKVWGFILLLYIITTKQVFVVGLMSSAPVFLFIIPITVLLLFGRKSGVWAVVASVFIMLLAIFLSYVHILPLENFEATEPFNPRRWTEVGISLGGGMLILLIILDRYASLMQNLVLESEQKTEEREQLIKEIHHRVNNNLQIVSSLLNMQINETELEPVRKQLADSQSRINAMALVYEQLFEAHNIQYINVKKYFTAVIMDTTSAIDKGKVPVQLHVKSNEIYIQMDKASPLGLALVELVGIRMDFGKQNDDTFSIELEISQTESELKIGYRDNGTAENSLEYFESNKSLSSELIESLVFQLSGSVQYFHRDGFVCQITIPLCDEKP